MIDGKSLLVSVSFEFYLCVRARACVRDICRGQKKVPDSMARVICSYELPKWVLGTKLPSSARASSPLASPKVFCLFVLKLWLFFKFFPNAYTMILKPCEYPLIQ